MEDPRAAIYLVGHGSGRNPRLIELQYLRIRRAIALLEDNLLPPILPEAYVDPVARNTASWFDNPDALTNVHNWLIEFPALRRLGEDIEKAKVSTVLIDLAIGIDGIAGKGAEILTFLKQKGADVINCYDLTPGLLLKAEGQQERLNIDQEPDYRDFIAFFPRLAGCICEEYLGYEKESVRLTQLLNGEANPKPLDMKRFRESIEELKTHQPKTGPGTIPNFPKKYRQLLRLQSEVTRKSSRS